MSFEFATHCECGTTGRGRENGGLLCCNIFKMLSKSSLANKENIPICRLFISVCGVISVRKNL